MLKRHPGNGLSLPSIEINFMVFIENDITKITRIKILSGIFISLNLNFKFLYLMVKHRNSLGQFSSGDLEYITIKIPGPVRLLRIFLIIAIFIPWVVILFNRINLKETLETILGFKLNEEGKKGNGLFYKLNNILFL